MNIKGYFKALLIFLVPPLGLAIERGFGYYFWVCLLVSLIGWFPGVLYAAYRVCYAPDETLYEARASLRGE